MYFRGRKIGKLKVSEFFDLKKCKKYYGEVMGMDSSRII